MSPDATTAVPGRGIHHVTLITRGVQANVDFYVGFLGLRLVKRTGGYEAGHELTPEDAVLARAWLDGQEGGDGG